MRIKLDGEYVVKGDADQVTLMHVSVTRTGPNAGATVEKPVGYYPDVSQALEAFATRRARMSDTDTISGYISELRAVRDEIRALVETAK